MYKVEKIKITFTKAKRKITTALMALVNEDCKQNMKPSKPPKEHLKRVSITSGILGAIAGDSIGAPFEFHSATKADFDLLSNPKFTDDTVMTLAVAKWLIIDPDHTHEKLVECMKELGRKYLAAGYGQKFLRWLISQKTEAYNSCGNGSAMRVSPCGFHAKTLEEALKLAKISAEVTHNHPEGIKGAQAIAACIFLARQGKSKEEIRNYVEANFDGYNLHRTLQEVKADYQYEVTCQKSVPESIICYLEANSYEQAIRNAILLKGDADTMACMAGAIAAATPGMDVPIEIAYCIKQKVLDITLGTILSDFNEQCNK